MKTPGGIAIIFRVAKSGGGALLGRYGKKGASHLGWPFLGWSDQADAAVQRVRLL